MPETTWTIRNANRDDAGFIGDMLVEAVNWPPERNHPRERILSEHETAKYVTGWPQQGDLGVIAEAHGQPVGAAWLRFFPASDPALGFVAADVPELSVGVVAAWRGQGAGRALLRALADRACSAGISQISLSVGRKNYAHKLYLAEGYRIVGSSGEKSDTMIKDLRIRGRT